MKLTNYIRDAFIKAAMADVPRSKDYDNLLTDKVLAVFVARLPAPVLKVWKDSSTRGYLRTSAFNGFGVAVGVPCMGDGNRYSYIEENDLTADERKPLDALHAEWQAETDTRDALERKLRSAAYGCTTRKALADLLPEFAHYLPPEEAPAGRTLPVVTNMVADFVKAGWPKNKKGGAK